MKVRAAWLLAALLAFGCDDGDDNTGSGGDGGAGGGAGEGGMGGGVGGEGGAGGGLNDAMPMPDMGDPDMGADAEPPDMGEPDAMPPDMGTPIEIIVENPDEGAFLNFNPVAFNGTVDPAEAELTVDERPVMVDEAGAFTTELLLREGENMVVFSASLPDGGQGELTVTITIDTANPDVMVLSPEDDAVIEEAMVDVTGTVDQPNTTIVVNEVEGMVEMDGSFIVPAVPLEAGPNTLMLTATDAAGNVTEVEIPVFFRDLDADIDGDGLSLRDEEELGTDPENQDTDGDGLLDGDEVPAGANPLVADTDEDGIPDGAEVIRDETDPNDAEDRAPTANFNVILTDGGGFRWDVRNTGAINDGSNDAFDTGIRLFVDLPNGEFSQEFPPQPNAVLGNQGQETIIGPAVFQPGLEGEQMPPTLSISRRAYASPGGAWARFVDSFTNTGEAVVNFVVRIESDQDSAVAFASSNGDNEEGVVVNFEDRWVVIDDSAGANPSVGYLFSEPGARVGVENVELVVPGDDTRYTFPISVQPGQTVALMHFAAQGENEAVVETMQFLATKPLAIFDGLSNTEQRQIVNFNAIPDTDRDGLNDDEELEAGTGIGDPDSDDDGLLDGFEVANGFDPLMAGEQELDGDEDGLNNLGEQEAGTNPADADTDRDGLNDGAEVNGEVPSDPLAPDGDEDGLLDVAELEAGTNPLAADTDDDGLTDFQEINETMTNPLVADTDEDGLLDGWEVLYGFDPLMPGGGMDDPDEDGLTNAQESAAGSNPRVVDTDDDGLSDFREVIELMTDPAVADTDGGGRNDFEEVEIDQTDPLDGMDDLLRIPLTARITDGRQFLWDILQAGSISNGTSDAYDNGVRLAVNGQNFGNFPEAVARLEGRYLSIGPFASNTGLQVVRRIYVPAAMGEGYARFQEFLINPTNAPIRTTVRVFGNFGSDGNTNLVGESSGNMTFGAEDNWIITDDADAGGDPTLLHVFSDARAAVQPTSAILNRDNLEYSWDVEVPANGRAIIMHFASQNPNRMVAGQQQELLTAMGDALLVGISLEDRLDTVNMQILLDSDEDGLPDIIEMELGTNPMLADTDMDTLPDGFEVDSGLNPLMADNPMADPDMDGLTIAQELEAGTLPLNPDTDDDGLNDGAEVNRMPEALDPLNPDSDGDGLNDGEEVNVLRTNPLAADSDMGGRNDFLEVRIDGTDPTVGGDDWRPINPNDVDLIDSGDFLWDMNDDAEVVNGSFDFANDAFDTVQRLSINGTEFNGLAEHGAISPDGRTLVVGPLAVNGVNVVRKVFVPEAGLPFARYTDYLINPTGQAINADIRMRGDFGQTPFQLAGTSSGDAALNAMDNWFHVDDDIRDGNEPAAGVVFSNADARVQPSNAEILGDDYIVDWVIPIPANGRAILYTVVAQRISTPDMEADMPALAGRGREMIAGIPGPDLADVVNFNFPPDADFDGLPDAQEMMLGTNPNDPDTDNDGLTDFFEVENMFNPLVAGEQLLDNDMDGLNNLQEQAAGTTPGVADTDEDGLTDGQEVNRMPPTDPLSADSDRDGLSDGFEVNRVPPLDPLNDDSDNGGISDGVELEVDMTDPLDPLDDVVRIPLTARINDGGGFLWDVLQNGSISNGTNDAYDGGLRLEVNGTGFQNFPEARGVPATGGREFLIGPQQIAGMSVTRRLYIPDGEGEGWMRFAEILENPGAMPVMATVRVFSNLGSDGGTVLVGTSNLDEPVDVFTIEDNWLSTDDANDGGGDPSMGHYFSNAAAIVQPQAVRQDRDNFEYSWQFEVPAGGRAVVVHFASQNLNRAAALARMASIDMLGESYLQYLDVRMRQDTVNLLIIPDDDRDRLSNEDEIRLGTNPNDPDTDDDGMPDGYEVEFELNPLVNDAMLDADMDGLNNLAEFEGGTPPNDPDADDDGLNDGAEAMAMTDPFNPDSDGDDLPDGREVNELRTNPLEQDTDMGGTPDGREVLVDMTNPLDAMDDIPVPFLFFEGIRNDIPPDDILMGGFEVCYQGNYNDQQPVAQILQNCNRDVLMLACRRIGAPLYQVAAMGDRAAVIADSGNANNPPPNVNNGVNWYWNNSYSIGFAPPGEQLSRNSCDTFNPGNNNRLCWHSGGGNLSGGWRCGSNTGLNAGNDWERVIFHRPAPLVVAPPPPEP